MKGEDILDPADEVEAEMAMVAHKCLVTALDHSKADYLDITIDSPETGTAPVLRVPPRALHFLADVLRQMAKREPMVLVPHKHELTTQDAANFLNVSRPFLIKEIEANRLRCRKVGRHRRIEFEELRRYQAEQKARSEKALQNLADVTQSLGMEL